MTSIVNYGKQLLRDTLLATVKDGGIGTGTSPTNLTMIALEAEVMKKATENIDGGTPGQAVFRVRILTTEANGNTLAEVGLFDVDGNLLLRRTHAPIEKDNLFEILYDIRVEVRNQ